MITNSKEILSQDEKMALRERIQDICKKAVSELMDPTSQMSDEERAQYEQKIFQKLKQGKRLSSAEMNYLQIHNPTMYQKALRVQNAKERLQTRLEHCRSKEEANDVIAMEMSAVSDKDPDREYMLAGLQETAKEYRQDSHYSRLPDTREQAKKTKNRAYHFEEDVSGDTVYSPIIEVMESLPVFDQIS